MKALGAKRVWVTVSALVVVGLLVGLAAGCGSTTTTTKAAENEVVEITEDRDGSIVRVAPGYTIKLKLEGNASTGFAWEIAGYDDTVIKLDTPEPEFRADSDAVGAGGMFTWTFEARAEGGTELTLDYVGPDKSVEKSFSVEIMVEPGA